MNDAVLGGYFPCSSWRKASTPTLPRLLIDSGSLLRRIGSPSLKSVIPVLLLVNQGCAEWTCQNTQGDDWRSDP